MVCRLGAGYRTCASGSRMALGGFFISGRLVGLQGLLSPVLIKGMVYRQVVCREGCLVNLFKKGVVELWEHQRSSSGRCCLGFVSERGGFLVGPVFGLSWRVPCPRCAWVPLSESRGGRVVNSERGLSPGQTASVLLKQHDPCIPPRYSARGKGPDSPAKPNTDPTRKQATLFKA